MTKGKQYDIIFMNKFYISFYVLLLTRKPLVYIIRLYFFVFFGSSSAYPPNFRFYFTKKIFIGVGCRCQSNYPRKTQRAGGYWTIKKPPVIVTDGFYLFVENVNSISAVYYPLFCSAPLRASACRYSDIR